MEIKFSVSKDTTQNFLKINMPAKDVNENNLTNLLASKSKLIQKALNITDLSFYKNNEWICFPWFKADLDEVTQNTYINFIVALCNMSIKQKRITAKEKEADNEKYAFRCFLLRLGFIGDEFKVARKILLKNLSGSSAFKVSKKVEENDELSQ